MAHKLRDEEEKVTIKEGKALEEEMSRQELLLAQVRNGREG